MSQAQPLLLVVENLHWIDTETQACLDSLVESLPTAHLLLLVTYRPEYQHLWGNKTSYSQLRLDALPLGARVGTSSLRRQSQLRALRSDLSIAPLRGNVDTRLRKLDESACDGVVLAAAGLKRLGFEGRISQYFAVEELCPAVGQGALAIEIRRDDSRVAGAIKSFDHTATRSAVGAERAALRALGGGCDLPFAAYGSGEQHRMRLLGVVAALDGTRLIRAEASGPADDPESLGARLAQDLEKQGARTLLASAWLGRPT